MRRLLPDFILEQHNAGQSRGSFVAAGLFVDLSGFSAMADALAQHEQAGAEALTEVMRAVFEPLVRAVYSQGGFVVGYAGDAFTAIFPNMPARAPAVLRCLAVGLEMQAHTRLHPKAVTPYGRYPIYVKVGIGSGQVDWQILYSPDGSRATYCVRGSCVDEAVVAEECARPGEIMLNAATYLELEQMLEGDANGECYRLSRVRAKLPEPHPYADTLPAHAPSGMFFPEDLLALPSVGEFRQVVNLFIDIPIDPTNEAFVTPFMESIFELQERYGGFFLRPEIGDKGFNLLMFWGAPAAHETDVERALNFILELLERTKLPLKAGVTYLKAYAGFMGASLREDYTAYGWGVNLAARFMGLARPGEVWLDEETAYRAGRRFTTRYEDAFTIRGFARKQKVFKLLGRKDLSDTVYQGELVGRNAELKRLSDFVAPLLSGQFAGVLVVQGEAGIGKSRLVHTFQSAASQAHGSVQWIICQTDEILRQSLNPFHAWLQKRFRISPTVSNEVNLGNFNDQLRDLVRATPEPGLVKELERTSSVLAALLGLNQPGSLYEQLDAKGRYENTFIALSALMRAESLQKPLLIFIEDIQWLDDDSRAFLPHLVRTTLVDPDKIYPIAILATRRPDGEAIDFGETVAIQSLELERLSAGNLESLAKNILGAPASDILLNLLVARSEGNPFFAEQILRYLSEKALLVQESDGKLSAGKGWEEALPLGVGAVLIARLDSLAHDVREVVQTASILGREFEVPVLSQMLHGDAELSQKIAQAERADIWISLDEIRYIFYHAMLRDAAYSMQLSVRLRKLHALALFAMEVLYASDLKSHFGELAYHAECANLTSKACYYLIQAGHAAADSYQNSQAMDYFSRALALTPVSDVKTRFELLLEREKLYGYLGERALQSKDLGLLKKLAQLSDEDAYASRVWDLYARFFFGLGDFPRAADYASRAALASNVEVALDGYAVWPLALLRQGNPRAAFQRAEEGLGLARHAGKRMQEGYIANSLGLIALEQKDPANARQYLEYALAIARETGVRNLEARSLNNLANSAAFIQWDFASAREYYQKAYAIVHERGDRAAEGVALANLGWVAGMEGDFLSAHAYQVQALAIAREIGDRYQEAYTLINLSAVAGVQGEAQVALQYARQARELTAKIGERVGEAWSLFYMGQALLQHGDIMVARDAFQASINIREDFDQSGLAIEVVAGLLQAALAEKDLVETGDQLEKILSYLEDGGTLEGTEEPLRIFLTCYQALVKMKDPRSSKILREAAQLLEVQVSKFPDEEARRRYVENVPWRLAIQQAWITAQQRSV